MSQTIWKFPIKIEDKNFVSMPKGSEVLTCKIQKGIACIWAIVNPVAETEIRCFEIIGTGNPVIKNKLKRTYISTILLYADAMVFHVFEIS